MDGGIDRREWTLQHHKAADITLTPPQADLDADCLDVNVKGPGETVLFLSFYKLKYEQVHVVLNVPLSSLRWLHPSDGGVPA